MQQQLEFSYWKRVSTGWGWGFQGLLFTAVMLVLHPKQTLARLPDLLALSIECAKAKAGPWMGARGGCF